MNKKQYLKRLTLLSVFCYFITFQSFAQQFLTLEFFEGSFANLSEKAKQEQKPFLIFFEADNSPKSVEMDSILANKWVQTYISKRYLAMRLRAFSIYAEPVAKKYGITDFPCVVLFAPNASVTHKIESVSPPKSFIATLTEYQDAPGSSLAETTNSPSVMAQNDPLLSIKLQEEAKIEAVYKIAIEKHQLEARTLAVQVGVFSDYENLMKNVMVLKENWHDNILITQYEMSDKRKMFRLLLGPLYSIEHAQSYKNSLKEKKGIEAIIVNMETFAPVSDAQAEEYRLEQLIQDEKEDKKRQRRKNR
ncbi:MAG: hypothetical protein EAZ57_05675 [Cytophagales bacterium]|nr:MAG: hypothetical protein EAZ67_06580 [Cytophagales bacterium]TAF60843.1 MAG: hypothetical protein EAZ57_05675 [Cytophagales bacterium]